MKNLFANLNPSISQQMVNLADQVTYRRPSANRTFDQIFMHGGDMIQQTMLMHSFLSDKDELGDDAIKKLWNIFSPWASDPKYFFRDYTVNYLLEVMKEEF